MHPIGILVDSKVLPLGYTDDPKDSRALPIEYGICELGHFMIVNLVFGSKKTDFRLLLRGFCIDSESSYEEYKTGISGAATMDSGKLALSKMRKIFPDPEPACPAESPSDSKDEEPMAERQTGSYLYGSVCTTTSN